MRYSGKPAAFLRGFKAGYFAILYNFIVLGWVLKGMGTVAEAVLGVDPAAWPSSCGAALALQLRPAGRFLGRGDHRRHPVRPGHGRVHHRGGAGGPARRAASPS